MVRNIYSLFRLNKASSHFSKDNGFFTDHHVRVLPLILLEKI